MEKCGGSILEATKDVVVLALDLGAGSVKQSPEMVKKIIQDGEIQKAIQKALLAEGKRLASLQRQRKPAGTEQGGKVLAAIGKAANASAQAAAKKQIESTSEFRSVKAGLTQLECTFKKSPTGVFIDENSGWLIIVASGVAIGGAAAMYAAKSGDWAASQMATFASKKLRFKVLGNVELGLKTVKFKPSNRQVELTTLSTAKWKSVKASIDLHVAFKDDKLTTASTKGEVVVPLGRQTNLTGTAAAGYGRPTKPGEQPLTYNLGLGVAFSGTGTNSRLKLQVLGFVKQDPGTRSIGGAGNLKYNVANGKNGAPNVNLTLGAKASRTEAFQPVGPNKTQSAFETKLGFELNF